MHRCVYIWRHILQNYNYKLHFQNLSIYHILHVSMGTLAWKSWCLHCCDAWEGNTADHGKRNKYMLGLLLILISKSWGCLPLGPGMPFLDIDTWGGGGGVVYLFLPGFLPYMMPSMDGWWDRWMNGWKKLHEKWPQHPFIFIYLFIYLFIYIGKQVTTR